MLAVVAVVAVAWPVLRRPPVDSFPLSNYPMFTQVRPRSSPVELAVAVTADGSELRLAPALIGGTIEVIHAAATVRRSVAAGRAGELCEEIAGRVEASLGPEVVAVQVVRDHYDVVDALAHGAAASARDVLASCPVGT